MVLRCRLSDSPLICLALGRIAPAVSKCCRHLATGSVTEPQMVHPQEAEVFMHNCFRAAGVNEATSKSMSAMLVKADTLGNLSHGMNRLEMYLNALDNSKIDLDGKPVIVKESETCAQVDGGNAFGVVVGDFCTQLAIKKAKREGVCLVTASNSNHYGVCCYYTEKMIEAGMVGITMTNSSAYIVPTRSRQPMLGTNPIACGAPAEDGDHLSIDTSTSMVAMGKVEIQRRKKEPVPLGWAQGPDGKLTTDAEVAAKTAALRPLGGGEESGGHKGYGLACVVDIMCGVLSGARYSTHIKRWGKTAKGKEANGSVRMEEVGQIFLAINPKFFSGKLMEDMTEFLCILRNCKPVDPEKPVLVAGDLERIRTKEVEEFGGVLYSADQMNTCAKLSERYKVPPIKIVTNEGGNDGKPDKC